MKPPHPNSEIEQINLDVREGSRKNPVKSLGGEYFYLRKDAHPYLIFLCVEIHIMVYYMQISRVSYSIVHNQIPMMMMVVKIRIFYEDG